MCGKICMFLCVDTSQPCSCCCPGCVGTEAAHIKPGITEMSDVLSWNRRRSPATIILLAFPSVKCVSLFVLYPGEVSECISPLTLQAVTDNTSQLLVCYCKGLTQARWRDGASETEIRCVWDMKETREPQYFTVGGNNNSFFVFDKFFHRDLMECCMNKTPL